MKTRALLQNLAEADLRLLRIFMAIAESGGLTAAELRLNISRSVISRHLKDLEARLGMRLCERGRAGFALTEEGAQVLEAARRLLAQVEHFRGEVARLQSGMRGELLIVVFDKFVTNPACRLAECIARLGDEAPDVGFDVHVAGTAEIDKGLLDGRFHVGIHPVHRATDSLVSVPLFDEPTCSTSRCACTLRRRIRWPGMGMLMTTCCATPISSDSVITRRTWNISGASACIRRHASSIRRPACS